MKKIFAIIPMRSGSQRVINKNKRVINGKFLYEYIIEKLLNFQLLTKIIINTDINEVIEKYKNNDKIIIVKRSDKLKGNCDINLVISESIKDIEESDLFIQTHATNPMYKIKTLKKAINFYFENYQNFDSLFSVTKIHKRFWYDNSLPVNHSLEDEPTTQNLIPYFEENSCFYLFTKKTFLMNNNRIGNKPKLFEIPKEESWDVDEEADLLILEKLLNIK